MAAPTDRVDSAVGVIVSLGGLAVLAPCDPGERRLDLGLAQRRQAGAGGAVGGDGGQALLHVAAVLLEVNGDERLEAGAAWRAVRSPRASRWSARLLDLSRVQAWKAATSWPWSIRPF